MGISSAEAARTDNPTGGPGIPGRDINNVGQNAVDTVRIVCVIFPTFPTTQNYSTFFKTLFFKTQVSSTPAYISEENKNTQKDTRVSVFI